MIFSQLTGGLGNQLYNYAIGYALAKDNGDELTLDISAYPFSPRPYVLNNFSITAGVESMSPAKKDNKLSRMVARAKRIAQSNRFGSCKWIKEDLNKSRNLYYPYDFSYKNSLYLEGYWQNYRYFEKYHDDLVKEVIPKTEVISSKCQQLIKECSSPNSVALHIRRGDYEADWCIGDDYYDGAIDYIKNNVNNPVFYIFCQDEECAREYLGKLPGAIYVTGSYALDDIEEFCVMKACGNHIIANSTYSFWAAYLCENREQKVVAPVLLQWSEEYYPDNWEKITIRK